MWDDLLEIVGDVLEVALENGRKKGGGNKTTGRTLPQASGKRTATAVSSKGAQPKKKTSYVPGQDPWERREPKPPWEK